MATSNTQVVLQHAPNLTRTETHRVIAVLEKAVERLHLLAMLDEQAPNPPATVHAEGSTVGASTKSASNDEASRGVGGILEEQKQLEARYERLILATQAKRHNPMDPLLDPACFSHVRNVAEEQQVEELKDVSRRLKEQSRLLCRQLKDNPNDAENWQKIVSERAELGVLISSCVRELQSSSQANDLQEAAHGAHSQGSYEQFAKKVLEEQVASQWAEDLVKREKDTNKHVKTLQQEVKAERALKEAELEKLNRDIAELKTQLRDLKQEVKNRMDRLKAETEAATEAQKRAALDAQRVLNDRLKKLELLVQNEEAVTADMKAHIYTKIESLDRLTDEWTRKSAKAQADMETEKHNRQTDRNELAADLSKMLGKREAEEFNFKAREAEKERRAQNKQREEEIANAKYAAATKLQASIKAFFTRATLTVLKKKASKKKK
jgi:hypothetical protein